MFTDHNISPERTNRNVRGSRAVFGLAAFLADVLVAAVLVVNAQQNCQAALDLVHDRVVRDICVVLTAST